MHDLDLTDPPHEQPETDQRLALYLAGELTLGEWCEGTQISSSPPRPLKRGGIHSPRRRQRAGGRVLGARPRRGAQP